MLSFFLRSVYRFELLFLCGRMPGKMYASDSQFPFDMENEKMGFMSDVNSERKGQSVSAKSDQNVSGHWYIVKYPLIM